MPFIEDAIRMPHNRQSVVPAPGSSALYPKSDGRWYTRNGSGAETALDTLGAAWTTYTPALVAGGTHGNATGTGGYVQMGKTVHFWARVILGSTSTITAGALGITLPVAAGSLGVDGLNAMFNDVSGNFYFARGFASGGTASLYIVGASGAAASVSSTTPFTWTTGDGIYVSGTYQAA